MKLSFQKQFGDISQPQCGSVLYSGVENLFLVFWDERTKVQDLFDGTDGTLDEASRDNFDSSLLIAVFKESVSSPLIDDQMRTNWHQLGSVLLSCKLSCKRVVTDQLSLCFQRAGF